VGSKNRDRASSCIGCDAAFPVEEIDPPEYCNYCANDLLVLHIAGIESLKNNGSRRRH